MVSLLEGVLKKYGLQKYLCSRFGISPNSLKKTTVPKKPHKRRISKTTEDAVIKFYSDSAIQLPHKRYISKKTLLKTGFLQEPISEVHKHFVSSNPAEKIGMKKFYNLRPSHIKPVGTMKYRGCLCEYCTNIDLKVVAINKVAHRQKMCSKFQGVYDVARVSMCPKIGDAKYNNPSCIRRQCKDCGSYLLSDHVQDILDTNGEKPFAWKKWEKKSIIHDGKTESRQVIVTKEGSLRECILELAQESEQITTHLFNASWQSHQFSQLTTNLPLGWVILVLDFAENYTCKPHTGTTPMPQFIQ